MLKPLRRFAGQPEEAIDQGVNTYTRFDGLQELRAVIARKARAYNGIAANPDTDITVSVGGYRSILLHVSGPAGSRR
jgi:aspartate/methionine/tyrosine aminotransferase